MYLRAQAVADGKVCTKINCHIYERGVFHVLHCYITLTAGLQFLYVIM